MSSATATYHPRVKRLALLLIAGGILVVLGLWLGTPGGQETGGVTLGILPRLLGMALVLVGTVAVLTMIPPLLQGLLRRSATLELMDDGILLAVGLDQMRKVSWSDISSVKSVSLKSPFAMGWLNIVFVQPRQRLGRELSLPDLYLDQEVDAVAETMNERLERWRYPFSRPQGQEGSS